MSMNSRPRSGRSGLRSTLAALALVAVGGCNYGLQGGGGFPADIRTLFVSTFENQTTQFDLDQQLFTAIQERVPRELGVRPGGREIADAVLEGRILRYDDQASSYSPGGTGARANEVQTQQVEIVVAARIVDRKRNLVLWESSSVSGRGQWRVESQRPEVGRAEAIKQIVQAIIDGAQSQW